MEEIGLTPPLPPPPNKESTWATIQEASKKFELFPAPSYKIQNTFLAPQNKIFGGSIYHEKQGYK